ncbi:MAG: response regulator [Acidimicrobiales bacterium]
MTTVLLATDADHLFNDVDAALASTDTDVLRVRAGADVLPVCQEKSPDLVILDLQIGNMGGVATCLGVKQEQTSYRLPVFPVALLLDRSADVFLAEQASADGWIIKPIDSLRLKRLATQLLAGETSYETADS